MESSADKQLTNNANKDFSSFSEIFNSKSTKKAPAYPWQDLALKIIADLQIPNFKRSAVFKVCRDLPVSYIERALNDTKELCSTGTKWKYFFKIVENEFKKKE